MHEKYVIEKNKNNLNDVIAFKFCCVIFLVCDGKIHDIEYHTFWDGDEVIDFLQPKKLGNKLTFNMIMKLKNYLKRYFCAWMEKIRYIYWSHQKNDIIKKITMRLHGSEAL